MYDRQTTDHEKECEKALVPHAPGFDSLSPEIDPRDREDDDGDDHADKHPDKVHCLTSLYHLDQRVTHPQGVHHV